MRRETSVGGSKKYYQLAYALVALMLHMQELRPSFGKLHKPTLGETFGTRDNAESRLGAWQPNVFQFLKHLLRNEIMFSMQISVLAPWPYSL